LVQEIKSGCVQGIISVGLHEDIARWIDVQGIPNVAFAGPGRYVVGLDSGNLVRQGAAQLVQQGCRKLALWQAAGPRRPIVIHSGPSEEEMAFEEVLQQNGLTFDAKRVRYGADHLTEADTITTETTQEQGYRVAMEVCGASRKSLPDGIVISDDLMTRGALTAFAKLGLRAGQDVKIATHANRGSSVLMGHEDELTLVEFDPSELVQAIFDTLETLMNGETPPHNSFSIGAKVRS
jgi:DNA-binding LacI/PurR family transcriptional regulator